MADVYSHDKDTQSFVSFLMTTGKWSWEDRHDKGVLRHVATGEPIWVYRNSGDHRNLANLKAQIKRISAPKTLQEEVRNGENRAEARIAAEVAKTDDTGEVIVPPAPAPIHDFKLMHPRSVEIGILPSDFDDFCSTLKSLENTSMSDTPDLYLEKNRYDARFWDVIWEAPVLDSNNNPVIDDRTGSAKTHPMPIASRMSRENAEVFLQIRRGYGVAMAQYLIAEQKKLQDVSRKALVIANEIKNMPDEEAKKIALKRLTGLFTEVNIFLTHV